MKLTAQIRKLFPSESKVKAVASLTIDDRFAVHGIKIIDSPKGLFVAMPNEKLRDKYRDVFHPITKEARQEIIDSVMNAYEQQIEKANQQSSQTPKETPADEPEPAYSQVV